MADGDVSPIDRLADVVGNTGAEGMLVVAADGGLRKADVLGLDVDLVVGDGDSLPADVLAELERRGIEVQRHPSAKDASDTELAVREAVDRGARDVVVLCALGGRRFDHALANVLLLAAADIEARVQLVDGPTTVAVIGRKGPESLDLTGTSGDFVSLLPLSERVEGVTTAGLAFPLERATLLQGPTLGLSNELIGSTATVEVERGRLAVVQTRREGMS